MYLFNKLKSDKYTLHIQKVCQGGKDEGKELDLVTYSRVATVDDNSEGDENPNESKEHISAQGKGVQEGIRFGRGAYKPNYNSWLFSDE